MSIFTHHIYEYKTHLLWKMRLNELWKEVRTIVLVTHNPELGNCAQRVTYLHHGRVVDQPVSDTPAAAGD